MSFFDPVLDAFANLGDSVADFAETDAGKAAMIAAAAYLSGGTSLGAEATIPSWDVLPAAVVPEGASIITPASIAASTTATPVVASQAPIVSQGIPSIPPAGAPIPPTPTLPVAGATPETTAGITAKGSVTFDAAGNPVYTSGTIPSEPYGTTSADRLAMNSNMGYQGSELPMPTAGSTPEPSAFSRGLSAFTDFATQHPYITGGLGYLG
jgi:hypothetical protein